MSRVMRRMRRGDFHLNVVGRARRWFAVAALVMMISIVSLAVRQINAGLEFRGGTAFEVQAKRAGVSVPDIVAAVKSAGVEQPTVQKIGNRGFLAETRHLSPKVQRDTAAAIAEATGVKRNEINIQDVGPKWGRQITNKAIRALIIFLVVVVIYMSVRLEPKMAGAAMLALVHDLVVTAGIYSLTGFVVTPATVIALLTVLGYSLYDTVVIFDRVKERTNVLSASGNVTYADAVNASVNQVLMRSLNTSITGLLPVGSLLFVGSFLLGAQTLRELALALFVGLTAGAYSSIFIASPALAVWKEREPRWTTLRARIGARRTTDVPAPMPPPRAAQPSPVPAQTATAVATQTPAVQQQPAHASSVGGSGSRNRRKKKRKRKKR